MDVAQLIQTITSVVLGAAIVEWGAGRSDERARRRESAARAEAQRLDDAARFRDWNRQRVTETRRLVLAWTEWIAGIVKGEQAAFSVADYPNGNLGLVGDEGARLILATLPVDLDGPRIDGLRSVARMRLSLMRILERQDLNAVKGLELEPETSTELADAVSMVYATSKVDPGAPPDQ